VTKIPSHVVLLVMIYWPLCMFGGEHQRQGRPFALATRPRSYGHVIVGRPENENYDCRGPRETRARAARLLSCVTLRWEPLGVTFGHLTSRRKDCCYVICFQSCPSRLSRQAGSTIPIPIPKPESQFSGRTTQTPDASLTRPSGAPPGLDTPLERGADNEQGARGPGKSARGTTFTAKSAAR
jgi:hypothetical protein